MLPKTIVDDDWETGREDLLAPSLRFEIEDERYLDWRAVVSDGPMWEDRRGFERYEKVEAFGDDAESDDDVPR